MIYDTEFDGGTPVGTVLQGFGLDPNIFEPLDGRTITRTNRPRLSPMFPIGKHTGTVRTLASNGGTPPALIATANHFVAAATTGSTSAIQHSTDGASWTTAATPSATVAALLATAARFIALCSSASQPLLTTTLTPSGAWATATGGPTSVAVGNHVSRMSYSTTLGRALVVASTRFSLDDGVTAFVGRSSSSGMGAPVGTCWSGTRYVNIAAGSAVCEFSADAITYTAGQLAEATSASQGNIASDGNGTIVVSGCPSGLQVSHDHGDTWRIQPITGVPASDTWRIQRSGDRFVVSTAQGLVFSLDGRSWFLEPTPVQAMVIASAVAKKGAVTVQIPAGAATVAYSFTESATEFLLPNLRQHMPALSGNPIPLPNYHIKAL
jgi:hypothetical protein